ncbi:MAG TPA: hypothetical protein VIU11_00530 [Nakamurella sp.]
MGRNSIARHGTEQRGHCRAVPDVASTSLLKLLVRFHADIAAQGNRWIAERKGVSSDDD